jgi:hypothetical protein
MNISAIDQGQKGARAPSPPPGRWQSRRPALRFGLLTGAAGLLILATACTAASPRDASAAASQSPSGHGGTHNEPAHADRAAGPGRPAEFFGNSRSREFQPSSGRKPGRLRDPGRRNL